MKRSINLRDFLTVFFKYKTSIFLVWAAALLTIVLGNQLFKPIYEAASSVMVNFGREYLYIPEIGKQPPYNYYDRSGLINAEIEILASRDLIEKVIMTIGVDRIYPPKDMAVVPILGKMADSVKQIANTFFSGNRQGLTQTERRLAEAIDTFAKNLSVLGSKESNVIRILFQHNDAKIAAEAVNHLVDFYQEKHLAMFRDKRLSGFLNNMVETYQRSLQESEQQLKDFKEDHGALSLDLEEEILTRQRGEFDSLWKNNKIEEIAAVNRLASLEEQLQSMSETTPLFSETAERDRVIDNTKAELLSLKLKEKELLGTYRENSSQIKNVRERIQLVETFLQEQTATKQATVRVGRSFAHQEIERDVIMTGAELKALQAKDQSIKEKLADINNDLLAYLDAGHRLRGLVRQRQINEQNYLAYTEKLEDSRINSEMDNQVMTNIRVIHEAVTPHESVRPRKLVNLLVGFILGGLGGIGVAFYRNYLNQGINSPDNLERLVGLPVLATVKYLQK